jgi:ribosomal-protein-alanine N-acetyltransferase
MNQLFDFSEFPTLETERLILREITAHDAEAVFQLRSDYEVTKHNGGAPYDSIDQAIKLIDGITRAYAEKREIRWAITLRGQDALIGMCGYNYWDRRDSRASIGYDLVRRYWGRGIMPEALHAMIHFGFERLALNRIEADTSTYNAASVRVLEKLGFQREGVQREQYYQDGRFHDLVLFGLLKRDYEPS